MKDFIAIFDSGIGGLTVYNKVKELLPNENIVYLADTLNCPYGTKNMNEIHKITMKNINYLTKLGAKVIVIACNTATSSVVEEIEEASGYLQGVIKPTAILAKNTTINGKIGLFATNLTVSSKVYENYLEDVKVYSESCSEFVPLIEAGDFSSPVMKKLIKKHLKSVKEVDTLILGCTHFPYIKDSILEQKSDLLVVESGVATANEVIKYLSDNNLMNKQNNSQYVFLTTSQVDEARNQLAILKVNFDEIKHIDVD